MLRRSASVGQLPKASQVRRSNSTKQAAAYYRGEEDAGEGVPLVLAAVVPQAADVSSASASSASPLKVGQAVQVSKAGVFISELARIKAIHSDGTYDVSVFCKIRSEMGSLKEELVLTRKPFPSEVRGATAAAAARLAALESKPPEMWDAYKLQVVREHDGREEWGQISINGPGFRWERTVRDRQLSGFEMICCNTRASRRVETVPGAEERNQRNLLALIVQATRWRDAATADVYCGGSRLESLHMFRVHSLACAGLPLVVVREGQPYDRERWASIAERSVSADDGQRMLTHTPHY
jgi:hypothetical protein